MLRELPNPSASRTARPRPPAFPALRPREVSPRPLGELSERFGCDVATDLGDLAVSGVAVDTEQLAPGDLFAALPGAKLHGAALARRAARAGAVAVLTDRAGASLAAASGLPVLVVERPRSVLGEVAAWIYRTAEHAPTLLGVTGTNGKTSTVHILDAVLAQLGTPSGLSSTVERRTATESVPSRLTTPESSELHALIARMAETGVRAAAVEVSAQAMSRHRVDGLWFDVVGFTGLSHDHLDEYADMHEYLLAKVELFQPEHARRGVVAVDSTWGAEVVERAGIPCVTVSTRADTDADWRLEVVEETADRTAFVLRGPEHRMLRSHVALVGRHMAANAALAIVMLLESGVPFDDLRAALVDGIVVEVPGRSVPIAAASGPKVFVDFAHTPDAFATTLSAIRRFTVGKVLMVVGADGDRDPSKRSEMGRLSAEESDILIVTDHHPRFEDPGQIRAQLVAGSRLARHGAVVHEIAEPARAIRHAVALAGEGDSILWAGPGLTSYRDVRGAHVPYSSYLDARAALNEAGWS